MEEDIGLDPSAIIDRQNYSENKLDLILQVSSSLHGKTVNETSSLKDQLNAER